jgi:hypothetical protein
MPAVSVIGNAIIDLARVRRSVRRQRSAEQPSRGASFIAEHAPGRSFVDIGGMFGIDGDVAFAAEAAGASTITLFDAGEPTPGFLERSSAQGSRIRTVQGDLEDPVSVEQIGPHQVVWCAGVIYHTPNPVQQLINLRRITTELLYLSTATIPEIPGFPQACVYYPYLARGDRAAFARGVADPAMSVAVGTPFDERPMYGHGNFWFGMTPSAVSAMLHTARFEVVEEIHGENHPWGTQFIARPLPLHPSLPPVDYFRRRGELLREGRTPPFDGYYDKGPDAVASADDAYPRMDQLPAPDAGGSWARALRRRAASWLRRS